MFIVDFNVRSLRSVVHKVFSPLLGRQPFPKGKSVIILDSEKRYLFYYYLERAS